MEKYYNKCCKCGCGQKVKVKLYHKYYGIPDYINGHQSNGVHNPNFKDGKSYNNKCIDCDKKISRRSSRCKSCAHKGDLNGNYKGKKYFCIDCGRILNHGLWNKTIRCRECYRKFSAIPENNPNYIDGRKNLPYPIEFNESLKELIRNRDNRKCQLCGCPEIENCQRLSIHHIDYNKANLNKNNLISLCRSCSGEVNKNRDYWRDFFTNKLKYKGVKINGSYIRME